jgi:hypothetical protein
MTHRFPLSPADESYSHQDVAPALSTAHLDPAWAERCWHLLNLGDGWVLGAGRATWPHGGRRTAVAGVNTGAVQFARRAQEDFAHGDDPNMAQVGPIRIEAVRPLREVRLVLDDPDLDLGVDLTYEARFLPVPTDRNTIEREGQTVTDYMNFFQSGYYTGVVRAEGQERRVQRRAGFRDRGWGLRKHEGSARRGMHVFCACELPDEAVYALLYETSAGRRVFTNGWLLGPTGALDTVTEAEHDLRFDGRKLLGGRLSVSFASGATRRIEIKAEGRVWMESVGYTAVPGRGDPGADRLDLADPQVQIDYDGLFDNACRFNCDGVDGHGFVEVGLGVHARYRPERPDRAR